MRYREELIPRRQRTLTVRQGAYMYTEDNVPVCNIYMKASSFKLRKPAIIKHFAKFGAIRHVKITYGRTRRQPMKCTVCYKVPIAAKAALQHSMHTINYEAVTVKACPTWEQPNLEEYKPVAINNMTTDSILILNDYCLEIIYLKLDLKDQIRLSLCHERLEGVFMHMVCPRKIKSFNLRDVCGFTLWETRQLFKTAGQFMLSFQIAPVECPSTMKQEASIYKFMYEFCTNVQRIQIICRRFSFTNFPNVRNTNYITELELFDCNLCESELVHLRLLKNLQTLGLARNRNIRGLNLCNLKNVQKLSLFGCAKVCQENLIEICKALPLRYLDARCMNGIRNWGNIVEYCKVLEILKISRIDCNGRENAESIVRLPKLKKLEMQFYVRAMPSSFYEALAVRHAEDLEELKITGNIYALFPTVATNIAKFKRLKVLWIGDNDYNASKPFLKAVESMKNLKELNLNYSIRIKGSYILPLLKHCPKLTHLSLRFCKNVTNEFVMKAIAILRRYSTRREAVPLLVLVGGSSVTRDVLKDSRYKNAKHLIRISFHITPGDLGYLQDKSEFDLVEEIAPDDADMDDIATTSKEDDDSEHVLYDSLSESSSDDEFGVFFWS